MKIRPGPPLALLLLIGLGAWVYVHEFRGADDRRRAEEARERPLPFERTDVSALRIENAAGTFRVERRETSWALTEPREMPADKETVEGILSSLEFARIVRRIGTDGDPAAYALDTPQASITLELSSSEQPQSLRIGAAAPIGSNSYVLLPGGEEVALVSGSLDDLARKDLLMLRDKSLLGVDPWKVERLRIERGPETVVLTKPDQGWKLLTPVEAPADGPTVTDLLSEIDRLRARSFVAEQATDEDLRRYGLDQPAARVSVLEEGWEVEQTILFGRQNDDARYARTVGRDAIVTVPAEFWSRVTTSLFDLRRRDLLGLNRFRVRSITVAREGGEALVLARGDDDGWAASGMSTGTAPNGLVETLLAHVSDLKAVAFIDRPSEGLRASLNGRPALDLTLEQDPNSEAAEPLTQQLLFGAPDQNAQVKVRDLAWAPIALAPAGVYERILRKLDEIVTAINRPPEPQPAESEGPAGSDGPPRSDDPAGEAGDAGTEGE